MDNCEFVTLISIIACTIAKDKTSEELAILSAVFTQLRGHFSYYSNIKISIRILINDGDDDDALAHLL